MLRVPSRLCDQTIFLEQQHGGGRLAGKKVRPGEEVERELQLHECTRFAGELNLTRGQDMQSLVVPQLGGDDVAGPRTREPRTADMIDMVGYGKRQLESS